MLILSRVALFIFLSVGAGATGTFPANFILAAEKIDINTAPMEELIKIIHIKEARAKGLISLRPFSSLDDLVRINGISESRIKDIKEQGLAWVASSQLQPAPQQKPELKSEESGIEFNPNSVNITSSSDSEQDERDIGSQRKQSAAINEQAPEIFDNSSHIFLIALGLAIFSGAAILSLKKKLI